MNFETYQTESARTVNHDLTDCQRLEACALGLIGEAGEVAEVLKHRLTDEIAPRPDKRALMSDKLYKAKLTAELGDVCWYVAEAARLMQIILFDDEIEDGDDVVALACNASAAADALAKGIDVGWYLTSSLEHVQAIGAAHGISLEEILQTNIDKLRARHPDGWSAERSRQRNAESIGYHYQLPTAEPVPAKVIGCPFCCGRGIRCNHCDKRT